MATKETNELKIEKGIPIPAGHFSHKGHTSVLRQLKVGDSVLLPVSLASANSTAVRALGTGKYACRTAEGGTRVWRKA